MGCCDLPGPFVFGGVCEDEVEVELELELELDEEEEVDDEDEDEDDDDEDDDDDDNSDDDVEVVVGEVVVVVVGAHDSSTAVAPGGRPGTADSGVPAGRSRFSEIVAPVASRTVTTHASADAVGSMAMPCTASTKPTVASKTVSFRRLTTFC